ncbi:MAG: endonuclease/exonuclease/phosphatase family protein [Clostridiales bacterium]|nr:endonuclease/exonuclease/phosphatase family protein [Clostridiales bacterium]MDR2713132.1 endonuclease/exonuclease/phosphatase family protein [Clostridiales bacterium]
MNILFWNVNKKKAIDACLEELILAKDCDIVVLAEYENDVNELNDLVNISSRRQYNPLPSFLDRKGILGCKKIHGLIDAKYYVEVLQEEERYKIVLITTSIYKLIIAMIHNISLIRAGEDEQSQIIKDFVQDICEQEEMQSSRNTIIIGDLNVNPFEKPCVAANVLHAIPYKEMLCRPARIVQNSEYLKFYNPMWKFLYSRKAPYGTYFYDNSGHIVNYYWNTFDQVIVRPQLINAFDDNSLSIITQVNEHNLLFNGKPNKNKYSDHLPIYFNIKEELIL